MGGTGRRRSAARGTPLLAAVLAAAACGGADGEPTLRAPGADYDAVPAADTAGLLLGVTYTHHSFQDCSWDHRGILATYHEDGVADRVHDQFARMREGGLSSLRLLVWHMRDVPRQYWGVVPSRGGRLPEPYRSNLVAYLTEARRFGFARLTVSFSPQWANSPLRDRWVPGRIDENWAFLQDVRALAREHGPAQVRFDLLNEGAPSDHAPPARRSAMLAYVRDLWQRYTDAYGAADATVSVIAPEGPEDRGRRLENLLAATAAAGAGGPAWIELHLNYDAEGVAWGLRQADSVLTARGLGVPVVVGETSYGDPAVADVLDAFRDGSDRPLDEVVQWYRRAGADCEVSPPYDAGPYGRLGAAGR